MSVRARVAARCAPADAPSASLASAVLVVVFTWASAWGCWKLRAAAAAESQGEAQSIAFIDPAAAPGGRARLALGALLWLVATAPLRKNHKTTS